MAYNGLIEFFVHLETFRNINLSHQGIYNIKVVIYTENNDKTIKAIPLDFFSSNIPSKKSKAGPEFLDLKKPSIENNLDKYSSKHFAIRYFEEEIELNDFCLFRIEVDLKTLQTKEVNFYIEVELYLFELLLTSNNDKLPAIELDKFKLVSTKKYLISDALQGIYQYVPVVFDLSCYSLLNVLIHSSLIDFRFRPLPGLFTGEKESPKKTN